MTLAAPPGDPAELTDFPARTVPADYPYTRIHHDRYEPEWFCDQGDCRFDLPAGEGFGTCYLAGHPLGAFIEKFGRLRVVPRALVDQHSIASLRVPSPVRVADVTDRTILGRWTLSRRGIELLEVIDLAAGSASGPMNQLHAIADGAIGYFERYPDFRRMLRHVREPDPTIPPVIAQFAADRLELATRSFALMTGIVEAGQAGGEIRAGAAPTLLHFYMTLVYEQVFLAAPDNPAEPLPDDAFHDMIDGALRQHRVSRRSSNRATADRGERHDVG